MPIVVADHYLTERFSFSIRIKNLTRHLNIFCNRFQCNGRNLPASHWTDHSSKTLPFPQPPPSTMNNKLMNNFTFAALRQIKIDAYRAYEKISPQSVSQSAFFLVQVFTFQFKIQIENGFTVKIVSRHTLKSDNADFTQPEERKVN